MHVHMNKGAFTIMYAKNEKNEKLGVSKEKPR